MRWEKPLLANMALSCKKVSRGSRTECQRTERIPAVSPAIAPLVSYRWILLPGAARVHARIGSSTSESRDASPGASRRTEKSPCAKAYGAHGGEGSEPADGAFESTAEARKSADQRGRQ